MSDLGEYKIRVFCDDQSSRNAVHRGRVVEVISFFWWLEDETWSVEGERSDSLREGGAQYLRAAAQEGRIPPGQLGMKVSEASEIVRNAGLEAHPHEKHTNSADSYLMRCSLCRLDVPRHKDAVWPVLERLRSNGLHEIGLRQLQNLCGAT